MDLMLREGLVPVIIEELNTFLTSDDEYHKKKREEKQQSSKKRKLPKEESRETRNKVRVHSFKIILCEIYVIDLRNLLTIGD